MSILRSGEILPRIENRSGETFTRGEERFGRKDCGELRSSCDSRSERPRLAEREEERPDGKGRVEPRTGCGSGSKAPRLSEREEDFLEERFERAIGMVKSL
jgi:hypothetical protein